MNAPSPPQDVIVIGAGAAGLFCAATCARRNRSVLVLDHGDRSARKVLISGGGRCNFTNLNAAAEHYHSQNPHFCRSALSRFTPTDLLDLVRRHRIAWEEKEAGQLFCAKSSREMALLLEREAAQAGATVLTGAGVEAVAREGDFMVATTRGRFRSRSLVIATGGLSYANLGATGFGHDIARQFGLRVIEPRPALVPFVFNSRERAVFGPLAGISLPCSVRSGGRTFRGNLLFTHKGMSGPAMLQASLYWEPGESLLVDLLPDKDILEVLMARRHSKGELRNFLAEHLPRRMSQAWCEYRVRSRPLNHISDKDMQAIARELHAWEVVPRGTEGYGTAEVTVGGVDTAELSSKTMEAKNVPGLFFIGEVMDVTGQLGGYNLHWAWASGHAAGEYA